MVTKKIPNQNRIADWVEFSARHLKLVNLWSINATRVLVLFIYITAAGLIIGLGVVAGKLLVTYLIIVIRF